MMFQSATIRPDIFQLQNGSKVILPFSEAEYENRLGKLRALMSNTGGAHNPVTTAELQMGDILVVGDDDAENITRFPYGPEHNIVDA